MDDIFHAYAVSKGLSDSAFWILYTLCQADKPYTQNDFCAEWYYSKQTIHSCVAGLVKEGYVTLERMQGSRSGKCVTLTEKGAAYADENVRPIIEAETRAFDGMSEQEQNEYLTLVKKHIALFDKQTQLLK